MSLRGGSGNDRRDSREQYLFEGIHRVHNCTCLRSSTLNCSAKGDFRCKAKDHRSFDFGRVLQVVVTKRTFHAENKTKDP